MAREASFDPEDLVRENEARSLAEDTRALVIGPYLTRRSHTSSHAKPDETPNTRLTAARLDEARGLALAIDLSVVDGVAAPLSALRPSTYLGKGKVEEFAKRVEDEEIALVMMDCALSPVQQRNLERAWKCKVIDRTGMILEIFGRRARTKEGTLQVELAHLNYQKSRLVRSWTHLERQRGGFGFLGGPGETQIETDRRLIQERMTKIERELETVKRTRALHRAKRQKAPYPVVALVGYTNAGKSTLFNRMTQADVVAEDMLFATLDPTARAIRLPNGATAILSDTVGFISDLPTQLVAAFRATLEDVLEANVLLHVRDIASPDTEAQSSDVEGVLRGLGMTPDDHERVIEVWNKADLLPADTHETLAARARLAGGGDRPVLVSALTGEGIGVLLSQIERRTARGRVSYAIQIDGSDGAGLNWLHEQVEVLERRNAEDGHVIVVVRAGPERQGRLEARFPKAKRLK